MNRSEDPIGLVAAELASMTDNPLAPAPYLAHVGKLGVDERRRRIYLGTIEEDTSVWVAQALHHLAPPADAPLPFGVERGEPRPIEVWLNTPGGSVTEMFALHDLFRACPSPLTVVGYGQVASAGVLLLACGKRRLVTESCVLMSHESKGLGGDDLGFREAKDRRRWEDWNHLYWCELMARYTPRDAAWWKRTTERQAEYWLLGGAAIVEAGIADAVLA